MSDGKIEPRIARAARHAAPDVFSHILASCREQKERDIPMTETKKERRWLAPVSGLAAVLALCAALTLYGGWRISHTVDSVVMLDVNPSVSLTVNQREQVIDALALNSAGQEVLDGMPLAGVDLDVAVNAIIGSMLQKGFLSELQNAVLVSVENADADKSAYLQARVTEAINGIFQGSSLDGAVLSQAVAGTEELDQLVQAYGISLGKAALIQEVAAQDPTLSVAELAQLSINEIALISQSRDLPAALSQDGAASGKAYIGQDAALEIACAKAGVPAGSVSQYKAELDGKDGAMVYEVEFSYGAVGYACEIDAVSGEILEYGEKAQPQANPPAQTPAAAPAPPAVEDPNGTAGLSYIGEDAAKAAALGSAGLQESGVDYVNVWMEYDDGCPEHYEVEFCAGAAQYQYEIDLCSGAVLSHCMEDYSGHHSSGHHNGHHGLAVPPDIGLEAAKSAALAHAGFAASQVAGLEAGYDEDDGIPLYEVEFSCGGYEYEYKIDAASGAVLKCEFDR